MSDSILKTDNINSEISIKTILGKISTMYIIFLVWETISVWLLRGSLRGNYNNKNMKNKNLAELDTGTQNKPSTWENYNGKHRLFLSFMTPLNWRGEEGEVWVCLHVCFVHRSKQNVRWNKYLFIFCVLHLVQNIFTSLTSFLE